MTQPGSAGWYPDPSGRHQVRYWAGDAWTDHVADNGVQSSDPPTGGPPPAAAAFAPAPATQTVRLSATTIVCNAVVVGLGSLLFVDSFFDWLGVSASIGPIEVSDTANAWGFTLGALAVVLGVIASIVAVIRLCGVGISPIVVLTIGGLAFVLVLIKVIAGADIDTGGLGVDIEKTREIGIYVGLVLTAGIAGAGLFQLLEKRDSSA